MVVILKTGNLSDKTRTIDVYDATNGAKLTTRTWPIPLPTTHTSQGTQLTIKYPENVCQVGGPRCARYFSPDFYNTLATASSPDSNVVPVMVGLTQSAPVALLAPLQLSTGFAANPQQNTIPVQGFFPDGRFLYIDVEPSNASHVNIDGKNVLDFEAKRRVQGVQIANNGSWAIILDDGFGGDLSYLSSEGVESETDPALEEAPVSVQDLDARLPPTRYETSGLGNPVVYNGTWAFLATAPTATLPTLFTLSQGSTEPIQVATSIPSGLPIFYGPWPK